MNVPLFNQRDPSYAGVKLDNSSYYLNDYGCAVTSVAMVLKYYGKNTDPVSLNNDLTSNGGMDSQGLIHWMKVTELYPDITCEVINCGAEPAPLNLIDECLNNNIPVIVETRFGKNEEAMHFVVLTKKNGEYWCNDPWFNDNASFNVRYGDPQRWIYSLIIYKAQAGSGTISIPTDKFEELVTKATKYDGFVSLGFDDPNKIKQKMEEIQAEMDGLNSQIRTLTDFQKQLGVTLQTTDQPNEIVGEITRLIGIENLKNSLEKEVNNLKIDIEELKRDKERLNSEISALKVKLQDATIALEGLEKEKTTISSSLSTCELKLQNLINDNSGKLISTWKIGSYIIQFYKS